MIEMIGRAREAAAIARFAERVPSGPVGLLIEGDPGIGKSTMLSEAIRTASDRGYRVLHARPAEAEADLSFAALGDLMSGVFDEVRDALPAPQRRALEVALLLREADEPADPLTTANALVTALMILNSEGPLVIAIDDAQWTDQASRRAPSSQFVGCRGVWASSLRVASRMGQQRHSTSTVRSGREASNDWRSSRCRWRPCTISFKPALV